MAKGLLIKGYNGFYYVESAGEIWTCSLRGRFRIKNQDFLAGDHVEFTKLEHPKGVIEKVYDRTNQLVRPAVANVEKALVTFAFANPQPDFLLLDRILIQVLFQRVTPVICFNKRDLVDEATAAAVMKPYQDAGFETVAVSAGENRGIETLKEKLDGRIVVLAGPSGVGKSSILNRIDSGFCLATGALSRKTERGRHTTRRVELLPLGNSTYIADTPGFSALYLPEELKKEELAAYYPEFAEAALYCRFTSCLHDREQDCEVKNDVAEGILDKGRYQRYCTFLNELKEREGKY
ncbi:MAG TPA: ribosome small subunit-dependent GTPase A [Clostridiales bacterium]|nr:ribosome small subunit-dependent GTPase A [Clostridiales bacterium]